MFGFSGQGSPLPLLLDDELSVSVMVHPIVETQWARWVARDRLQAWRLSSRVLSICSGVGAGLGRRGLGFLWAARRSPLRFKISSLFLWYHSRFRCFAKSEFWLGILNSTGSCLGSLSISIVLSSNHSSRSRDGAGGGNLVPMGETPLILLLPIKPLT